MTELVLSIQSHVAYGHAGNSGAVFPLQRLGVEVLPVHTVQFSNHTGYGAVRGQVFDVNHVREVLLGLEDRGLLPRISAVLSGYMGDPSIGDAILEVVGKVKSANPKAIYLCDPVFGDVGRGVFVRPGIPEYHQSHTVKAADIITPNQFEFEQLTGEPLTSIAHAIAQARKLAGETAKTVVITSLATPDVGTGELGTLAVTANEALLVRTPQIDLSPLPNGMGDAFSAVILGHLMNRKPLVQALELATATLFALVKRTVPGSRDLPLIEEQAQIVEPAQRFAAVNV